MNCRICNQNNHIRYKVSEMMYGTKESFEYFKCNSCGCLQIAKIPDNIGDYYSNAYYSLSLLDETIYKGLIGRYKLIKILSSLNQKPLLNKIIRLLLREKRYDLLNQLNITSNSKILDVGTGNGMFLFPLSLLNFKSILGIDPYLSKPVHYKNGLKVLNCNIFEVESGWDLITYNHVFEHIADPQKEMIQIAKILNPNGICIISIPTVSSYAWYKYRIKWFQLDAPRHFYLHTQKSIEILAEKAELKIKFFKYNSLYTQFYYSELYKSGICMKDQPKKGVFNFRWQYLKIKYTSMAQKLNRRNLGDQFSVVLEKK